MSAVPVATPPLAPADGFWLRALRHRSFAVGAALTLLLALAALLSFAWTPYSPYDVDMPAKLLPASAQHWFGTDAYGRDVASLLLVGARASIAVGVIAVGIGLLAGTALGLLASARRGWVEEIIMRVADFGFAFPAILSAIMLTAVFGPGMVNAIIAIGLYNIPTFARIARASANTVWSREFVLAARACGKGSFAITIEHVLPNILSVLIVQFTLYFAVGILTEAGLSYLGVGVNRPNVSWGLLLKEAQDTVGVSSPLAVWPGLAIVFAVLGLNLLGDGLRDVLDPRLRKRRS